MFFLEVKMKKQFFYGLLALGALFGVGFADAMNNKPDVLGYMYQGTLITLGFGNIEEQDFTRSKQMVKGAKSAIVNAANPELDGGTGVNGAIHGAAKEQEDHRCSLRKGEKQSEGQCAVCQEFKGKRCDTGNAVFGKPHSINKPNNYGIGHIIHAVGPDCRGNTGGVTDLQRKQLASAYRNSLQIAVNHGITHIAFPQISVGIYKFTHAEAIKIVVNTIKEFIDANKGKLTQIRLVMYNDPVGQPPVGREGYTKYQPLLEDLANKSMQSRQQQRYAPTKQQPKQQTPRLQDKPKLNNRPVKKQVSSPSFFSKYKTSIIIGGVGLGIIATALIASMFSK